MKTYYKATAPDGAVHLRASTRDCYNFANIDTYSASFHSKPTRKDGCELVKLERITVTEYNRLLKGSKQHFRVTYLGKVYSKTVPLGAKPLTFAVGRVERRTVQDRDSQSIKDYYAANPTQASVTFHQDLESAERSAASLTDGGWRYCTFEQVQILEVQTA